MNIFEIRSSRNQKSPLTVWPLFQLTLICCEKFMLTAFYCTPTVHHIAQKCGALSCLDCASQLIIRLFIELLHCKRLGKLCYF